MVQSSKCCNKTRERLEIIVSARDSNLSDKRLGGVIGISTLFLSAYTIYDVGLDGGVLFG